MTDYSSVKSELLLLLDCEEEELEKYDNMIAGICDSVSAILKDEEYETNARIIHLAAVKCYYRILLLGNQSGEPLSFKAGDVSYTLSSSAVDSAKVLYEQALSDCGEMLTDISFDFRAV